MIKAFCAWLAATPFSAAIQNHGWVIPAVQSLHILAIAIVATSLVVIDLKLLGVRAGGPSLDYLQRRFQPWIWSALSALLVSGLLLVIGEPARELLNPVFLIKMLLVVAMAVIAWTVQVGVHRQAGFWELDAGRRLSARALGAVSILLLLAIITCGRWIAYVIVE